jgi:hypothetical protein
MKLSWIHDQVLAPNNNNSSNNHSGSNNDLKAVSGEIDSSVSAGIGKKIVTPKEIKRIQLLLICYVIQKNFRLELEKIENNDWNKFFIPYTGNSYIPKMFQSISLSNTSGNMTSGNRESIMGNPSASNSGITPMDNSSSNNNNNNLSSAGVNNATGSVYINPTTIRGLISLRPFPEKEFKVFYVTGNLAGIKVKYSQRFFFWLDFIYLF